MNDPLINSQFKQQEVAEPRTYRFGDSYITQSEVIYETEWFFSIFDKYPVTPGHALIISKRKFVNLIEIQSNEWLDLYTLLKVILGRIKSYDLTQFYTNKINVTHDPTAKQFMLDALNSLHFDNNIQGFNVGINDGESSGRTINHFHMHIIPRFKNGPKSAQGGIRRVIPSKGDFLSF